MKKLKASLQMIENKCVLYWRDGLYLEMVEGVDVLEGVLWLNMYLLIQF